MYSFVDKVIDGTQEIRLFSQLLDHAIKEMVESRELNVGGGASKTRARRQDFEGAREKFQTVRQSELGSPALLNNHPGEVSNDGSHMRAATKRLLHLLPPTSSKPTSSDTPDYESLPSMGQKVIGQSVQYEDEPSVATKIVQPTKAFPITKPCKRRHQRDSHPEEDGNALDIVQKTPQDGSHMKEATTLQLPSPLKPTSSDTPDYPEQYFKDGRHIKEAIKSHLPMLPPAVPNTNVIAPKLQCLSLTQSGSEYPNANICNMRQCLNDEPIDGYSRLVEASENRGRGIQTVVQMGSFWYTKHLGNYTKDKDWPNKCYQKRANGDKNTIQQFHFLKELRVYHTLPRDKEKKEQCWEGRGKVEVIWVPVSKQKGLTVCGVFVCEMMRLTATDDSVELETTTENINRLRYIIAFELLQRWRLEDAHDISTPFRNDIAPKDKEAKDRLGEIVLTEINELGHGGEAVEEREKQAHTDTAASNTQAMELKDLQLEDTILEITGLEKLNQQKEDEVLIPETQQDAKPPAFEHSSTIGASFMNRAQFTLSKIKHKISTRKSPRSISQMVAADSSTPSHSNFSLEAEAGACPDEIVKARQLMDIPRPDNFPIADDLEFENALCEIIGMTKLEVKQHSETVQVPPLWLPQGTAFRSTSFLVELQLGMYMDLVLSSGVIIHCMHFALQLAKNHEVISLPVPSTSSEVEFLLATSGFVKTVKRDLITILWCDLHWQPLYMINMAEWSLIAKANKECRAVEHKNGKYEAVTVFADRVASLFQHPNTVSMALMGAMSWQDPFVVRKMNELANPARIAAVVWEFSFLMSSLISGSAKESLILDSDLRGDKSILAQRADLVYRIQTIGQKNCQELCSDQDEENLIDLTRTSPIPTSPVFPAR
ncbi:hypothetical protein BDD12DRAFT_849181 [Trichophaea hybrida]|nr:hypothetical protein BDD12DRAFT_849181 [Trichophaea hybrida]